MINFRFHIASLIAVFLALALGVVMGSTVIDRAIVDGLRNQIDRVESNRDAEKARNDRLETERNQLTLYTQQSAPWAVDGQLTDVSVAILAERGVDEELVKAQAELLAQAGATVPGILWLEAPWNLGGDGTAADSVAVRVGEHGAPGPPASVRGHRVAVPPARPGCGRPGSAGCARRPGQGRVRDARGSR